MKRIIGIVVLLCISGCASYPFPQNIEPHAVLNLAHTTNGATNWLAYDNACRTDTEHSGRLAYYLVGSVGHSQVNIRADEPMFLQIAHSFGAGEGKVGLCGIVLKFTPRNGSAYDLTLGPYCHLTLLDHDSRQPLENAETFTYSGFKNKYGPSCDKNYTPVPE